MASSDAPQESSRWRRIFKPKGEVVYRHRAPVRLAHWIDALAILFLLGSGLNIFNAHPRLYWGEYGADADKAFFEIAAAETPDGPKGVTIIGGHVFYTTGWLGLSQTDGQWASRAFPSWMTIPSYQYLSAGRNWHFLFAWVLVINGLVYLGWSLWKRHLQRDLWPTRADIKSIPASIAQHATLKHPKGEDAKRYNVLQKLAYLGVFVLIALMVLTGLTMSPGFNAVAPFMLDLFGGRQSARSIHFISATLIVLFTIVHLLMVLLSGPVNQVRAMLTGFFTVPKEKDE